MATWEKQMQTQPTEWLKKSILNLLWIFFKKNVLTKFANYQWKVQYQKIDATIYYDLCT